MVATDLEGKLTMTAVTGAVDLGYESTHRALWALGDYASVATDVVAPLGPMLVQGSGIGPGDHVLDVAAGAGNVAIPAAMAGADVIASDLCPDLLDRGRAIAEARGVSLTWQVANAEALPFGDGEFDAVLSCVGVMFAPHHQAAADEVVRVCRSDGFIGLISWTPEGFVGQMFSAMKPFVAAPPPGAQPAPLWGSGPHVSGLLGDRVRALHCAPPHAAGGPIRRRGGVSRLLQGELRSDGRRVPRHRGGSGPRGGVGCTAGRTRRSPFGRDIGDGVGVLAGHRAQAVGLGSTSSRKSPRHAERAGVFATARHL